MIKTSSCPAHNLVLLGGFSKYFSVKFIMPSRSRSNLLFALKLGVYTSVKHVRVRALALSCMAGYQNYLPRGLEYFDAYKELVTSLNIKVIVRTKAM